MDSTPSFFQRLATAARSVFVPGFAGGQDAGDVAVIPQGSTPPQRGLAQLIGGYATMPWLRAVAERIGRSVAACEWELYFPQTERGRRELRSLRRDATRTERRSWVRRLASSGELRQITEHPFLSTWAQPNAVLNGFNSRLLTTLYLDLGGDGAWLLERNVAGMPIAWWPIPPTWILSFPTASEPGYRVNLPGWTGRIPPSEVVCFVNVNPADPYGRGSGVARALADELETDEFTAKHLKGFFYNRARPDLLIYGKSLADLDKPQKRQLELDWRAKVGGLWNFWKPYFLRLAEVQIHELSQTMQSMEMTELRAHQRDTILHVFGAPPEVFGILDASNRSTIAAADFLFQKHLVVPRLELLRQSVQESLLAQYDERLVLEYVSPVEEDEAFYLQVAQAAPAVRTVDEWRELQGLEPHADPQSGSAHLVPFSTEPRADLRPAKELDLSQFAPPPPAAPEPEPEPEPNEPEDGNGPDGSTTEGEADGAAQKAARELGAGKRRVRVLARPGDERTRRIHTHPRIRGYSVQDLVKLIHAIADKVSPQVARLLLAALDAGRAAVDPAALATKLSSGQVAQVLAALPLDAIETGIREAASAMRTALLRAGELTAMVLTDQTGGEVKFDGEGRRVGDWLAGAVGGLAAAMVLSNRKVLQQTAEDFVSGALAIPPDLVATLLAEQVGLDQNRGRALRNFLDDLVDQQIPGDQISASLARAADALRKGRAIAAGGDQAMAAANAGRYEMWRQAIDSGAVPATAERTFLTADDADVCLICDEMDGQTVGVTEQYYSPTTGEHYRAPGPPPDGPHDHCRCGEVLVF